MATLKGKFLIVRSSAGSGKTYRLVQEYLRLALKSEDPKAYRYILAVTFTNKAAQEMLERVIDQLAALSKADPHGQDPMGMALCEQLSIDTSTLSSRASRTLEHMLHNFGDLSISTIDKFVNKVVRAFARDLKVTANYEIELEETRLLGEAVDRCISEIESGSPLANALIKLMLDRSDEERNWRIESELNAVAKNLLNEKGHQNLRDQEDLDIGDYQKIRSELYKKMKQFESQIRKIGMQGLSLIQGSEVPLDRFANGRNGLPSYFKRLAEFNKDLEARATHLKNMDGDKWYATKATESDKVGIDALRDELRSLFMTSTELVDKQFSKYLERKLVAEKLIALGVLSEVERQLNDIKDEQDILLISDLNRMISNIVLHEPAPFIYERLGEKYSNLLFDEFQDTSIMQWWNFLPLVENALSRNGFSLVVGDGKQAIYRWRNGEVQQFLELPEIFGHNNEPNILEKEAVLIRNAQLDHLQDNYRSSPEVIRFNNRMFTELSKSLSDRLSGIYDDHEQNVKKVEMSGYVRIQQVLDEEDISAKAKVVQNVINDIDSVLENGGAWRDITVLVRTGREGRSIADALEQRNIDVISPEALLLSAHSGVQLVMDLMAWMNDQDDLVAATRALTAAGQRLATEDGLDNFLRKYVHRENKETVIQIDDMLFKEFKIEHSASMRSLPSFELATTLANGLGLLELDDRYMTHFLDSVLQVSKKQGSGLQTLMDWWEDKKDSVGLAIPESVNAVSIMTIHKSKGLQFPVVIVPFADWGFEPPGASDIWLDDLERTYGPEHVLVNYSSELDKTRYADQYQNEKDLNLLDNLNMLYVAFTRAERVLISYYGKVVKNKVPSILDPALRSMPEWDDEDRTIEFASLPDLSGQDEQHTPGLATLPMRPSPWTDRAVIDSSSMEELEELPDNAHLDYGRTVHAIMSEIKSKSDVQRSILNAVSREKLDKPKAEALQSNILALLDLPDVRPFFQEGVKTMDEREICLVNGAALRPDRVLLDEKNAVIVEYKTGDERPKHIDQVNNYARELEAMGYNVNDKLILYIDLVKAVRA